MFPGETILSRGPDAPTDHHVSEFRVMQTPAGWYIGTVYTHCDRTDCTDCRADGLGSGWEEPNSRETDYFPSEDGAQRALLTYQQTSILPGRRT